MKSRSRFLKIMFFFSLFISFSVQIEAQTTIINDPLQGSTLGTQVGGTLSSEGYKPRIGKYFKSGTSEDHILYNVGSVIENGYVQFQVKGFSMSDFEPTDSLVPSRESGFITLYDGRGISEPLKYDPDAKHNYFYWVIHYRSEKFESTAGNKWKTIINCAEPIPARINSTKAVFTDATGDYGLVQAKDGELNILDRDWTAEPNGLRTSWDPNKWYTMKIEWNNNKFRVYLDGVVVWFNELEEGQPWTGYDNSTPNAVYPWKPLDLRIWLGSGPGRYDNDMPNIIYRNFKVVDYDNSNPPTPSITVTSPNGGELLKVGNTHQIQWNSNLIANVKIDFSSNNGTSWSPITNSTESDGLYSWVVPSTLSNTCLIRIEDVSNSSINDISNSSFSISEQSSETFLRIISPNGGEELLIGKTKNIVWNAPLGTNNVSIFFSSNYDFNNSTLATWSNIGNTTNSGNFVWTVPNILSNQCVIRIKDVDDFTDVDISDANFTIRNYTPLLALSSPNGGEIFTVADSHRIAWTSQDINFVKLEYSTNDGLNWLSIVDTLLNENVYDWIIPNNISTTCLIKITDIENTQNADLSDSAFSIIQPSLTLTSPNGGEKYLPGDTILINWSSQYVNFVNIEYSINNGSDWVTIVDSVDNVNEYSWTIPNSESDLCLIRITNFENNLVSDVSNSVFSIIVPSLSLVTPNGGEEWTVNSTEEIVWSSKNVSAVAIYYSIDEGNNWLVISDSTTSDSSFNWDIPNTISESCRIKIYSLEDSLLSSESENNFIIKQITNVADLDVIPKNFILEQNYPNPFNPSTIIRYAIPKETKVQISVYNVLGKQIITLVNKYEKPGYYEVNFNAEGLPSGMYFFRINTEGFTKSRTMLLLK